MYINTGNQYGTLNDECDDDDEIFSEENEDDYPENLDGNEEVNEEIYDSKRNLHRNGIEKTINRNYRKTVIDIKESGIIATCNNEHERSHETDNDQLEPNADDDKVVKEENMDKSCDESRNDSNEDESNITCNAQEGRNVHVYSSILKPKQLMTIPVDILDSQFSALLDSGSNENYIRESIAQKFRNPIGRISADLVGIGSKAPIEGEMKISLNINGRCCKENIFRIAKDDAIRYPIILGSDFLKSNRMAIHPRKKTVYFRNDDSSRTKFTLDDKCQIINVEYSDIPIHAKEDFTIRNDQVDNHAIEVNFGNAVGLFGENLYFEGIINDKIETFDGILNFSENEPRIKVQKHPEVNAVSIKKGDELGKVSTMIEMEPIKSKEWTEDELKDIKLGPNLTEAQKTEIYKILLESQPVLAKHDFDIGKAKIEPHKIQLIDEQPIWQKYRRFSEPVNQEIEQQCNKLLSKNIIEESHSSWSSPIVPVRKSDGSLRLCIDYRKVNKVTQDMHFPMPNLEDSIYSASRMKYFTKLDLVKGYYQIELDEDSKQYTAFSTPHNHYQFKVLPFGLKNSGIAFQRAMKKIFSNDKFKNTVIYIDDFLFMSENFAEHIELLKRAMNTLMEAGATINIKKCELFQNEVSFLGHQISNAGIRKSPSYIEKIETYPKPKNVTEMRQFLGLVNFQRKFVKSCSEIAKPLSENTVGPKRKVITWNEEMDSAFEKLKEMLIEDTILAYPDHSKTAHPFEIYVDASNTGAGACLQQYQNNEYRTIAYASTTFSKAQRRYSTIEREITALRFGVKSFKPFVYGTKFIIWSDHRPLLYLHNFANENSKLMRIVNELAEYDFVIKYKPGPENTAADALSRIPQPETEIEDEELNEELPKGLKILQKVEGGGDSFFKSLSLCLEELGEDEYKVDHISLRKKIVNHLLNNGTRYNIKLNAMKTRQIRTILRPGNLPVDEIILVAADVLRVEIWIHHGMRSPVIYKPVNSNENGVKIHMQCLGGFHFNPVSQKIKSNFRDIINENKINLIQEDEIYDFSGDEEDIIVNSGIAQPQCGHRIFSRSSCTVDLDGVDLCGMLDLGAQINLISESSYHELLNGEKEIEFISDDTKILGITEDVGTQIEGVIFLEPNFADLKMEKSPFAVVNDECMPCCIILGINWMDSNDIMLDFDTESIQRCEGSTKETIGTLNYIDTEKENDRDLPSFVGVASVDSSHSDVESDAMPETTITIRNDQIQYLQMNNHAIQTLYEAIDNNIATNTWDGCLNQFKRFRNKIMIRDDILVVEYNSNIIPIIPFPFLVNVCYQIHNELVHIGKNKLIELIASRFWHPAFRQVIYDICVSCKFCQMYKVSNQNDKPPCLKIKANHPFHLVAVDLVKVPRSSSGFETCLVAVDNVSKFLMVVPIRDKKSATVAKAFEHQILTHIVRIPDRILSDNGGEFVGREFNEVLTKFNIDHDYITANKPSSNGLVERGNRTLLQMLRCLPPDEISTWDKELSNNRVLASRQSKFCSI